MAFITLEHLSNFATSFAEKITELFVKKENGKGLSTNDYTTDDKEKLVEYISSEENIKLDEEAAKVIETVTGITIDMEEETTMGKLCKAVQDLMDDSREEGIVIGREKERIIILTKLINTGIMSVEAAADMAGMEKETFIEKAGLITSKS